MKKSKKENTLMKRYSKKFQEGGMNEKEMEVIEDINDQTANTFDPFKLRMIGIH